ncbi:MAG: malectin domain-containing carbohydrate-binding protein [Janthinobacterium lividum]
MHPAHKQLGEALGLSYDSTNKLWLVPTAALPVGSDADALAILDKQKSTLNTLYAPLSTTSTGSTGTGSTGTGSTGSGLSVWRIDAGAATATTTFAGVSWEDGSSYEVAAVGVGSYPDHAIDNTAYSDFFRTSRYGDNSAYLVYHKAVANGNYTVYFYTYAVNNAVRLTLSINGVAKETQLDVSSQAGGDSRALILAYNVTVTAGVLEVRVGGSSGTWVASGLEALAQGTPATLAA